MLRLKNIQAVFFDFGGTLVTLVPSREELFIEAAALAGVILDSGSVRNAYHISDLHHKYPSLSRSKTVKERFYADTHKTVCRVLGIEAYFSKVHKAARVVFKKKKKWTLFPDSLSSLKFFKSRHIPLALVANWDKGLPVLAKREGVSGYFKCILSSAEAKLEKPDPRFFYQALKKMDLGSSADKVLYIGNDYKQDVLGARSAGLTPILIDREKAYKNPDCLSFPSLRALVKAFR